MRQYNTRARIAYYVCLIPLAGVISIIAGILAENTTMVTIGIIPVVASFIVGLVTVGALCVLVPPIAIVISILIPVWRAIEGWNTWQCRG